MDSKQKKGINFDLDTESLKNTILKVTGITHIMICVHILRKMDLNIYKVPVITQKMLCQKQKRWL